MALTPRSYRIEEYTRTVCPHCFAERRRSSDEADVWKDGMLVSRDGSIWMRRFCAYHGETESLYEEDEALWRGRAGWHAPTLEMTPDRAENVGGALGDYAHGLPASHGQHTCVFLLNLTKRCNYACPTCYAAAQNPGAAVERPEYPTLADITHTVKTVIAREGGRLSVLMLSGGEPTVREDLCEIIDALLPLPITRILINTNGRRVARDDAFVDWLHERRERVEIYLQFDGTRVATNLKLRGEDVGAEKLCALQRLDDAAIWTTLVMTIAQGVNHDEVGDVVMLGLHTRHCSGVALQPVFGSGRNPGFDAGRRVTPTGVLARLGRQTGGAIAAADFIPLPCSHRDCCDITYLLRGADDKWRSLPSLIGRDALRGWIDAVANTISFEGVTAPIKEMVKAGTLARVFSEQLPAPATELAADLSWMCDCVPGLPELLGGVWRRFAASDKRRAASWSAALRPQEAVLGELAERTFRVTVKMFMDAHTFHEARLRQCCVHTGTYESDPKRYSFCWRWLFEDADDFGDEAAQPNAGYVALDALSGASKAGA